jgi:hypothetical protein
MVKPCILMSVHENVKCCRKADHLAEPFLGGIYI